MNAFPGNDGQVIISVTRGEIGNRDRYRPYRIIIDGRRAGSVKRGETSEIALPSGSHSILVAVSWCSSPVLEFSAISGERVHFSCGPAGHVDVATPWQLTFGRRSYLHLERVVSGEVDVRAAQ